jgi:hypothetical protein
MRAGFHAPNHDSLNREVKLNSYRANYRGWQQSAAPPPTLLIFTTDATDSIRIKTRPSPGNFTTDHTDPIRIKTQTPMNPMQVRLGLAV